MIAVGEKRSLNTSFFKSSKLWKDSALLGFAVFGVAASVVSIAGVSFSEFWNTWEERLSAILIIYCILVVIILLVKYVIARRGVTINVNGTSVHIRQGDLFAVDGWKVIPFNEYFDTTVDDRIISHSSLNGLFIDGHVDDIEKLREAIEHSEENNTKAKRFKRKGRFVYPLGRVIVFQDYLLLALTHFNEQNMAHISRIQYEECLMTMWHEISRTYAGKPVYLPLLASGITRFDDVPHKSYFDLLKCMLCTFRASGENINAPITILLTTDIMQKTNIYELKGAI